MPHRLSERSTSSARVTRRPPIALGRRVPRRARRRRDGGGQSGVGRRRRAGRPRAPLRARRPRRARSWAAGQLASRESRRATSSPSGPCSTTLPASISAAESQTRLDDVHLVGDQQDGQAELGLIAQQVEDRAGGLRVEGGGRLVGEQHLGGRRPAPGRCRRAASGRRRAARGALGLVGEPDQVEQFERLAAALRPRSRRGSPAAARRCRPRCARTSRLKCWKTMPIRRRAARSCPRRASAVRSGRRSGPRPTVGSLQQVDAADQRALAGAARPMTPTISPSRHGQVDAVEGGDTVGKGLA